MRKLIGGRGFNHLVEARHGYVLYNVNDWYIGRSVEHYGEWSPGETALFDQLCRPGHYVVDVGAHIGTHTLTFARRVGEQGRVFAFEPQRMVAQVLAANVALNSLTNVHTYHLGVGAEAGVRRLSDIDYSRKGNFGGASLDALVRPDGDPRAKYRVAVVRLDDFYDQPRLDLVKIDVQGMEADVLRGAGALIGRHRPVIYAENDYAQKSAELVGLIRSHGYRLFWHRPPLYSPDNFAESTRNIFEGRVVSLNMLCVHAEARLEVRGLEEITDDDAHPLAPRPVRRPDGDVTPRAARVPGSPRSA